MKNWYIPYTPLVVVLALVLMPGDSFGQKICRAGFYNLATNFQSNYTEGYFAGNRITVDDTATIEFFKGQGVGSGDNVKMALYAYQNGSLGTFITGTQVKSIPNGVVSLAPLNNQTILPGDYYLMAAVEGTVPWSTYDFEEKDTTNTKWYVAQRSWSGAWPTANHSVDSFCCAEVKLWLDLKCCPRWDTIAASACESYTSPSGQHTYTQSGLYIDTVLPKPYANCDTLVAIDLTIQEFDTTLTQSGFSLSSNDTATSYQWIDCNTDTLIPGATDSTYTDSTGGNFAVIIDKNGCVDTSACYSVSGVGINETLSTKLKLYPNPTQGEVFIEYRANPKPKLEMQLYNSQGEPVHLEYTSGAKAIRLQLPEPAGIYFLKLSTIEQSQTYRLIKL